MYRKPKNDKYIEPMPKKQLYRIINAFKRQEGLIIINDEIDKYLKSQNSEGITINAKTILLKKRPSRSAVFEELIHATQYRNGENDGSIESRLLCEIYAQEKLIKYKKEYRITDAEDAQTRTALKYYKRKLALLRGEKNESN